MEYSAKSQNGLMALYNIKQYRGTTCPGDSEKQKTKIIVFVQRWYLNDLCIVWGRQTSYLYKDGILVTYVLCGGDRNPFRTTMVSEWPMHCVGETEILFVQRWYIRDLCTVCGRQKFFSYSGDIWARYAFCGKYRNPIRTAVISERPMHCVGETKILFVQR